MTDKSVEQLWYTWSDVGIDPIRVGFRIRAASDGLRNYKSERVRNLVRYEHYSLPSGANPAIPPGKAPICLALINTGQERILVHKVYTGKDAYGRYGVFFVHLLAGLPAEFSVLDAISLWKSRFWQCADPVPSGKERRNTHLDPVPLADLRKWGTNIPITPDNSIIVQNYLPYIIEAYLIRKPLVEKKSDRSQPLYIAAPGDAIALLIAGLTCSLPPQLTKNLTFSTYEHDMSAATTEIVGTGWLSDWKTTRDKHVEQLLPRSYYEEKLALNCYTDQCTLIKKLDEKSLIDNNPLAAPFARFATQCFLEGQSREFKRLLDRASTYTDLDVDTFLGLFDAQVVKAYDQDPSQANVEFVLNSSDLIYVAEMLELPGYQKKIISLTMYQPSWWPSFARSRLANLRKQSARVPDLAHALCALANDALPSAREQISLTSAGASDRTTDAAYAMQALIDLMTLCIAPPTNQQTERLWYSIVNILDKLASNGANDIKLRVLFNWLSAAQLSAWFDSSERNLAQILAAAHLHVVEIGLFFQRYGQKYVALYPGSAALLELLQIYTRSRGESSMFILRLWLDLKLNAHTLEQVLQAADLMPDDVAWFLHNYSDYIVAYPQSPILQSYLFSFLSYLCTTNLDIFKSNDLVRGPSDTEKLLHTLLKASLSRQLYEPLYNWYTVVIFIRKRALLQQKPQEVAGSIGNLLRTPTLQEQTYTRLLQMLARACLADERHLGSSLAALQAQLSPADWQQMLYTMARYAGNGVRQKRYTKTLLEQCILFALHSLYAGIEQQYTFLDTLLLDLEEKTYKWLKARMKHWHQNDYDAWQSYKSQRPPLVPVSLSWYEQLLVRWERRTAFKQMQKALKSHDSERIIRVGMDYLATLNAYHTAVPAEWWSKLEQAVAMHNRQKTAEVPMAWWYEPDQAVNVLNYEQTVVLHLSSGRTTGAKQSWGEQIKRWWECTLAFMLMWQALQRRGAGRIARILLDHVIIFETYENKVPAKWWSAIDAALDFFVACDEADEYTDVTKEQAIINASKRIDYFRSLGYPVPRLTMHEKQRSEQARQYVTRQSLPGPRNTGG